MNATLLLATTGGHLGQLVELSRRLPSSDDELWVTHRNAQSESALAGRRAEFVPYVRVRNVPDVLRCLPHAHTVWRHGVSRAVSTGSGIALGYLPYLAARGVSCHYIESAARVAGPSLTGRLLAAHPGIRVYTQYPQRAGRRWDYGGSVLDGYEAVPAERPRPTGPLRVVVTLGTAVEFPFRRLVERLTPLLAPGGDLARRTGRPVDVLWQTGGTPVDGLAIEPTPFLPAADLDAATGHAHLVVAHAGTGSALASLARGRFPVLVARRARDGEAGDDHQRELAAELARRGLAVARDADDIGVDDLCLAMAHAVRRAADPPPFALATGRSS